MCALLDDMDTQQYHSKFASISHSNTEENRVFVPCVSGPRLGSKFGRRTAYEARRIN